jgi:hypothetical protein
MDLKLEGSDRSGCRRKIERGCLFAHLCDDVSFASRCNLQSDQHVLLLVQNSFHKISNIQI